MLTKQELSKQELQENCKTFASILNRCDSKTIEFTLKNLNVWHVAYIVTNSKKLKGVRLMAHPNVDGSNNMHIDTSPTGRQIFLYNSSHYVTNFISCETCKIINKFYFEQCKKDLGINDLTV